MNIKYKMSAASCFANITWIENKLSDHKNYRSLKEKYNSKIDKNEENANQSQLYLSESSKKN